jgi:hypothetical protein
LIDRLKASGRRAQVSIVFYNGCAMQRRAKPGAMTASRHTAPPGDVAILFREVGR